MPYEKAMPAIPPKLRDLAQRQEHLLVGWESLAPAERQTFLDQLDSIDIDQLETLYRQRNELQAAIPGRDRITPIPVTCNESASACEIGENALRCGEAAALVVAGGQGSRLGFEKPKGLFPVGPVSAASLFQIHAEKVLALGRRFGKPVPFLVMTSPATDADTKAYFEEYAFFGLDRADVHFFQQGTMPAMDIKTGRLLLEKPGSLFLSPNGHGGTLTALAETGLLRELRARGVRHVFYFQVDNALVNICDPAFLGQHIQTESEASSKVVFKERPEEKVGVLALVDGKKAIVEYSDLPPEMAQERDEEGALLYRAGNPAIHIFSVDFLERITSRTGQSGGLAYHIARKKVPYFDAATGVTVNPVKENALKFEMFIFDALPLANRWLVMQTRREDEFAPLKNADGPDSPATVYDLLVNRFAKWLEDSGVKVPRNADGRPMHAIEISPLFARDIAELRQKLPAGFRVTGPTLLR